MNALPGNPVGQQPHTPPPPQSMKTVWSLKRKIGLGCLGAFVLLGVIGSMTDPAKTDSRSEQADESHGKAENQTSQGISGEARKFGGTYMERDANLGEIGLILSANTGTYMMTFLDRDSRHSGEWSFDGGSLILRSETSGPVKMNVLDEKGYKLQYQVGPMSITFSKTADL